MYYWISNLKTRLQENISKDSSSLESCEQSYSVCNHLYSLLLVWLDIWRKLIHFCLTFILKESKNESWSLNQWVLIWLWITLHIICIYILWCTVLCTRILLQLLNALQCTPTCTHTCNVLHILMLKNNFEQTNIEIPHLQCQCVLLVFFSFFFPHYSFLCKLLVISWHN